MTAPLEGTKVVEVDSWMAAPSAGAILTDLGADVIKVEPLSGDPMRDNGRPAKIEGPLQGYDFQFDVDNRGKRSITVDLTRSAGAELVQQLCARADVFLCNLLPHRQERFGLDAAGLFEIKSNLVHATLTGYGTEGPDAWRPGYDVTAFFARSGLYDAMREGAEGVIPMARPAQGDHTAGLAMVTAILAALRLVDKTGQGQVVETSLYETAVWTQASDYGVTAVDKAPVRQRARDEMLLPTANRYPCGDGKWIVVNMPEPAYWPKFCRAIDKEDWLEDERFQDPRSRYQHMRELVQGIDAALATRSRDEWGEIFDEAGLIWGPVLALHEVPDDPQARAVNLFPVLNHETRGEYHTVNIPMRFKTAEVGPRAPAPAAGEHTRAILAEAGLAVDEIDRLVQDGVVGPDSD